MADLIDRQAAIDAIEHRLCEPAYQHTGEDWYAGMNCAECELYDLPSAQPEIIRCMDCKHYKDGECTNTFLGMCERDFCSEGERRDGES